MGCVNFRKEKKNIFNFLKPNKCLCKFFLEWLKGVKFSYQIIMDNGPFIKAFFH